MTGTHTAADSNGSQQGPASPQPRHRHEILAVIEEATTARRCLAVAERAARIGSDCYVKALHICADPSQLICAPEELCLQRMRVPLEGTARQRLERTHRTFETWSAFSGVSNITWVERVGAIAPTLVTEARTAALIAIAAPHNVDSVDALHAAIFSTNRPVLFIPTGMPVPSDLGRHIAIAWKPRPQARRAILNTLRWLGAASKVSVIAVDEPETSPNTPEVLELLDHYAIAARAFHVRTRAGQHIADRLLEETQALGADSLVMGAYRFGELVEWIFGGVTREVLHRSTLPVFLAH